MIQCECVLERRHFKNLQISVSLWCVDYFMVLWGGGVGVGGLGGIGVMEVCRWYPGGSMEGIG